MLAENKVGESCRMTNSIKYLKHASFTQLFKNRTSSAKVIVPFQIKKQYSSRDAVLMKCVQVTGFLVSGLFVQVAKVLHCWHIPFGGLLWDIKLLHKLQRAWALIRVLVGATVMSLGAEKAQNNIWSFWIFGFSMWYCVTNGHGAAKLRHNLV